MTPKVFVPHLPTRQDPLSQSLVPTINLHPATRIGELEIINSRATDALPDGFLSASAKIEAAMEAANAEDYILMCGDSILCGVAIHCALKRLPSIKVLRWNREARNYEVLTANSTQAA